MSTSAAGPVIVTHGLGKTYPNGTRALVDVSLRIDAGEFVAIIGRSGAGKSTLLRCLNRLLKPTTGRYLLGGGDVTAVGGAKLRRVRQHVGMVFQQFNVVGRLSVLANVGAGRLRFCQPRWSATAGVPGWRRPARWGRLWLTYAASLARWLTRADREAAFEHLRQVGIAEIAFQRADTLSGGQQQRVAIARVLAQHPDVILADEPVASLDPRSAEQVMDTLREIQRSRGIAVLVNLHQVDFARRYATRILGMSHGQLVFDGPPEAVTAEVINRIYDGSGPGERARSSSKRTPPESAKPEEVLT